MAKKWIVGLGNPGRKYEDTRHNAGFLFIDFLVMNWSASEQREGHQSEYHELKDDETGHKIYLVRPQTFMNDSGRCLLDWKRREGLTAEDLLVVYDDMDLPAGKIRFRPSGSGGSHNGMASIIESLGTSEFARLRLGIGRPERPEDWANYVLRAFDDSEQQALAEAMDNGRVATDMWLKGSSAAEIMSRVNGS